MILTKKLDTVRDPVFPLMMDDLSDVKQLLKKLIKKVDSNDRVLKEM